VPPSHGLTLPPGYPPMVGQYHAGHTAGATGGGVAQAQARSGAGQARPPNVTINPSIMQQYAMQQQQYNAYNAMLNPALMYGAPQYDPQRSGGQMYPYPYNVYR